jgi:hypothetical protein
MPSNHIATVFLGQPCGSGITEGVNPEMHARLQAADRAVRAIFDALPPERRGDVSYAAWAGADAPHLCWRPNAKQHSAGAAIDINPAANPYIVTRNNGIPGGEAGAEGWVEMRKRALAAYDRAVQFLTPPLAAADVSPRRPGESTESVWARFKLVSDALARYLRFAIRTEARLIARVAIENADDLSDAELLAAIPEDERLAPDEAIPRLEELLASADFRAGHVGWPLDARAQYLRILRDYEHARIPMVVGSPSATPERTRNPARGFLALRREIVVALCDQGLRWGACDLEIYPDGSSHNGAMMHFDLADCGGYPEVNSLLRFG